VRDLTSLPSSRSPAQLRVGLIGANWRVTHIAAWRYVPGAQITAICTSHRHTAEAAAQAHGIEEAYWDIAALLRDAEIDIVDITPGWTSCASIALAALRAGRHVMHPLPLALDLPGARELLAAQRQNAKVVMVENLHRHSPTFMQAHAMIDAGMIGEVHTIHASVHTGMLLGQSTNYPYTWVAQRSSGVSALRKFGEHLLHTLIWLFGDIVELAANAQISLPRVQFTNGPSIESQTEDGASLLLRYASGANGTMDVSSRGPAGGGFLIYAAGTKGRLALKAEGLGPRKASLAFARITDSEMSSVTIDARHRLVPDAPQGDTLESLAIMCRRVAEAVRGRAQQAAPKYSEACKVMQLVENAYLASRQNYQSRYTT